MLNWFGYRLVADYFENEADIQLASLIDANNYLESELISIKVPASLPYGASSANFERVDGSININGVSYTYVKRRFYQDSLELLCIPNIEKTGIQNARDEFYKLANDFVTNNASSKKSSSNHNTTVKFSVSDFSNDHLFAWHVISSDILSSKSVSLFSVISSPYLDQLEKPPQVIA